MAKNGLILLTPSSVDKTGTGSTATINTNGSVTFGTCVTLSLNGVFTADYDNYMIVMRNTHTSGGSYVFGRLRNGGTDSTATTDYNDQLLAATATTFSASRATSNGYWQVAPCSTTWRTGFAMNVYGPFLAQPTAFRTVTVNSTSGATIEDQAGTHELSTSYDGITLYPNSSSFSGLVCVYGLRN